MLQPMRASDLLHPRPEGLYCPPGDFFIDPVRPVDRALITHGHSDHARSGHRSVLATRQTLDIMGLRYGEDFAGTTQAAQLGETDRARRRHRQLPSGRPCAGLGADRGRASGHAHRRFRRLQAHARRHLRGRSSRSPATCSSPRRRSACRCFATRRTRDEIATPAASRRAQFPERVASRRRLCARQGAAGHAAVARRRL